MQQQSRRGLLKNAAKAAAAVTGGAMLTKTATAQVSGKLEKKNYPPKTQADKVPATPAKAPLFSSAVSYGNLLFLAGVGAHFKGTIEEHTKHVLDQLEQNLINAGSSMEKVLKAPIFFLGLSLPEHGYHAPNENYDWQQAEGGMAAFARYFQNVAELGKRS